MPHHAPLLATLVAGLCLAFVLGTLAQRLKLPPLAGYLLAGVVCGPFTPGITADQNIADQLAEIGVILLMFGVGLHFSLRDLLAVRRIAIPGALVQIGAATAMGWAIAHALGWPAGAGLVFGLALSVASTVVLLRALEEQRLLDTERGRIAIGWLIVEDLAMVLALVLLPAGAALLGAGDGPRPSTGALLWSLVVTVAKVALFVALMLVVGRRCIPWLLDQVARSGSRELFRLAVLAIALGIAFGAAHLFGVSFALGAFFAGMVLGESELSHEAAEETVPLRDAFAVLFFVSIGMLFNPQVFVTAPLAVAATFAVIVLGKSVVAFVIVKLFGHPTATALTVSASLAQIGEFSFILAGLGVALELLPAEGRDLVLAGAILSILVNPLLFATLDALARRTAGRSARHGAAVARAVDAGAPSGSAGHTVLVGHGRVGARVAQLLAAARHPLVIVEERIDIVRTLRAEGARVVCGSAVSRGVLEEAGIAQARRLVVATPDAYQSAELVRRARAFNPRLAVTARAHSEAELRHLHAQGIDHIVLGEYEIAHGMADWVLDGDVARAARRPDGSFLGAPSG